MISPTEEMNSRITPTVPHTVLTLLHNRSERKIELNPQQTKKEVINHLCLPIAYSLIIRQLGLYSGLTKCSISRQSNDKAAQLIVKRANTLILFNEFFLEQFVQLIHTHSDTLLKSHLHNLLHNNTSIKVLERVTNEKNYLKNQLIILYYLYNLKTNHNQYHNCI